MSTPTPEQQKIRDAFRDGAAAGVDLVVEAGAGTGKTHTLRVLGWDRRQHPKQRILYVVFNKKAQVDAQRKFAEHSPWVECRTAHSLAYNAVMTSRELRDRFSDARRVSLRDQVRILGAQPIYLDKDHRLSDVKVARLAMEAVGRFCRSAADQVEPWHVPTPRTYEDPAFRDALREVVHPLAARAWRDVINPSGRLRFTFDHILKLWQMQHPVLPFDAIFYDEAQDASPPVARIVSEQEHAQRVYVGDRNQAINGFIGAVDAMSGHRGQRLLLTQSWRFGEAIAEEANQWLALLGSDLILTGNPGMNSTLGPVSDADAVLCRTNGSAITEVIGALEQEKKVALVGGGDIIAAFAEAAAELKTKGETRHRDLGVFTSWSQVQEYVDQAADGDDLKVLVELVDKYTPAGLIAAVESLVTENVADVVVSTAHKSKGAEWRTVRVAADFDRTLKPGAPGEPSILPKDLLMLAYVTVTRARERLDRGGLAWIGKALDYQRRGLLIAA